MTKPYNQKAKQVPLNIVGSSTYGRYPKISVEKTTNMIISDTALVPYAGYIQAISISSNQIGRGLFNSSRWGKMIAVIGANVYAISSNLSFSIIGSLITTQGDVFISENIDYQICICDKINLYIYNWSTMVFEQLSIPFQAGYIEYQDGRFIAPNINTESNQATWWISSTSDNTSWPDDAQNIGQIQTKGDFAVACLRPAGAGSLLYVFGNVVTEVWYDVGASLFPYQRSSSLNIDYGCLNPATIATLETLTVWLGVNEKSGPAILYSVGGSIAQLSTDGINYRLAHLTNPQDSYGFFFKQDGHLLYQLSFPSAEDNYSLVYDFTTSKFFDLTDENGDCHIAKRVVYFNGSYYFISFVDGNIYELSSLYTTYNYGTEGEFIIPRSRICKSVRQSDQSVFTGNNMGFTIEQGEDPNANISTELTYFPVINASLSRDGGYTYSSTVPQAMYNEGNRMNRLLWWNLGLANDLTAQFQFLSQYRFVVLDGIMEVLL